MSVDLNKGATVELVKTLSDDLRIGAEGTTYLSAGDAVRSETSGLVSYTEISNDEKYTHIKLTVGYMALDGNVRTDIKRGVYTDMLTYQQLKKVIFDNTDGVRYNIYDANGTYLLSTSVVDYPEKNVFAKARAFFFPTRTNGNSAATSAELSILLAKSKIVSRDTLGIPFEKAFSMAEPVWTDGYWVNYNDGTFTANDGCKYATADVSLFRGGNIKGTTGCAPHTRPTDGTYGMAFYDANNNYISGDYSTNAGSYKYDYDVTVPDNATYVRITLRKASADLWTGITYPWNVVFDNIQKRFEDDEKSEKDVVNATKQARHIIGNTSAPLTLLHFSDLHKDTMALDRIMAYASEYGSAIDDMICTGDMVANTAEQIASWWNEDVMTCIGNHDTASYNSSTGYNWTALSMADRDAYYIAPFESNWGITHTSGTSYYYKDYATQKVRLIVMDGMLYNDNGAEATAQTSWLAGLLSSAITNNLHVLIAIHAPHGGATAESCSFSRYGQGAMPVLSDCNTPQAVIDAVATAITGGMKFIGYIVGHTHQDNIWDAENNGTQMMYCITCASTNNINQWKNSDQYRTGIDAFNLVTIDTEHTLIKLVRGGGADISNLMTPRKAICFNYSTGEKVGEVL